MSCLGGGAKEGFAAVWGPDLAWERICGFPMDLLGAIDKPPPALVCQGQLQFRSAVLGSHPVQHVICKQSILC